MRGRACVRTKRTFTGFAKHTSFMQTPLLGQSANPALESGSCMGHMAGGILPAYLHQSPAKLACIPPPPREAVPTAALESGSSMASVRSR